MNLNKLWQIKSKQKDKQIKISFRNLEFKGPCKPANFLYALFIGLDVIEILNIINFFRSTFWRRFDIDLTI